MPRYPFAMIAVLLLAGCTQNAELRHQETLTTVDNGNKALSGDINTVHVELITVDNKIEKQNQTIDSLSKQLEGLNQQLLTMEEKTKQRIEEQNRKEELERQKRIEESNLTYKGKIILGSVEWVWLDSVGTHYQARVDSGATTSSLDAVDIQEFERDGKSWVRFTVPSPTNQTSDDNKDAKQENIIEAPVVRWVRIRQSNTEQAIRRPVINSWMQLGGLHQEVQFTLTDRTQMDYPVLLGRDFFKDIALVDVGQQFIQQKTTPVTTQQPLIKPKTDKQEPVIQNSVKQESTKKEPTEKQQ
ncbi:RimK/LysX family protein [Vibrio sp. SS-MA-C1-2]|uniref:ATP-dependent zinc protease family protein n=1 Tax=Vibrio sp. SS-MA-C1-2 TaxID=2908646 RepID=UPI001F2C5AF3|nr:ATP-dependent zinc protease [Vibrio sp. SS-MA-C1-2]UJF18634.1 RimK/LysX family protein [Vibrio sp. SS-MA-C1-2]